MQTSDKEFIGSWKLVEWTSESGDGRKVHPFGADAIGRITYGAKGKMSVQIMRNNIPNFHSEDPLQGQAEEIVIAYKGFIAYSGSFEVSREANQVVHNIAISSFPNWVGQNQLRNFEFRSDRLILSTEVIGLSRHKLIWEKMKN